MSRLTPGIICCILSLDPEKTGTARAAQEALSQVTGHPMPAGENRIQVRRPMKPGRKGLEV